LYPILSRIIDNLPSRALDLVFDNAASMGIREVLMFARRAALISVAFVGTALLSGTAHAANEKLKIGFVGVTSGPAAAWGTSNVRSMETLAEMLNERGGVNIGDKTYDIEIVTFDDQKDPKRAIAGMEKMAQEGIHYVVGPNVDDGAAAVRPVAEAQGIIYFPYAFPKELYTPPASNAVLGMVASYQSGPAIYKFLMENKGVKKVAFIAANESDPLSQKESGIAAAKALDLEVVGDATYQNDTRDFTPVLTPIVKAQPDLLVLSGVAPGNAPLLIRSARELGYEGLISTETAQDAKVLEEGAGELANGFISVGGASTPEIASDEMRTFVENYTKKYGEYNDESNTKVYALPYILETLKANPKAISDVEEFKKAIDSFAAPNPYVKTEGAKLKYVGSTSFSQKRQIAVPLVVNEYKDGKFETLFVADVD
jgi:branched-chain amino acid transport system substrate-binding protein